MIAHVTMLGRLLPALIVLSSPADLEGVEIESAEPVWVSVALDTNRTITPLAKGDTEALELRSVLDGHMHEVPLPENAAAPIGVVAGAVEKLNFTIVSQDEDILRTEWIAFEPPAEGVTSGRGKALRRIRRMRVVVERRPTKLVTVLRLQECFQRDYGEGVRRWESWGWAMGTLEVEAKRAVELFDALDALEIPVAAETAEAEASATDEKRAAGTETDIPDAKTLGIEPEPVENPQPPYPGFAMRSRIEGEATVELTVGTDGTVEKVQWVDGNTAFKETTVETLAHWRFKPVERDGHATAWTYQITVRYDLAKADDGKKHKRKRRKKK